MQKAHSANLKNSFNYLKKKYCPFSCKVIGKIPLCYSSAQRDPNLIITKSKNSKKVTKEKCWSRKTHFLFCTCTFYFPVTKLELLQLNNSSPY